MKRTTRTIVCIGLIAAMAAGSVMPAFAGTWKRGAAPNENLWWYDFDNGTYAQNGWQWIDGNQDGTAECYYFDANGWMLADTTTPDGYRVNGDGAWTENGIVKTQTAQPGQQNQQAQQDGNAQSGETQTGGTQADVDLTWCLTGDVNNRSLNVAQVLADYDDWSRCMFGIGNDYVSLAEFVPGDMNQSLANWAQVSERGAAWKALFERYPMPDSLARDRSSNEVLYTSGGGMTDEDAWILSAAALMMTYIHNDGMIGVDRLDWVRNMNDGDTVTVTLKVQWWG